MKAFLRFLPIWFLNLAIAQNTNISGIINQYYQVNSINSNTLYVTGTNGLAVNDHVLIIQMQGAVIQNANNGSYGTISAYNNAGNYEFANVQALSPTAVVLSGALQRNYTAGAGLQLIKVPTYQNATVNGLLTCAPWNGETGGVLAFAVCSDLNIQAPINVSGKGFRGGLVKAGNYTCTGDTLTYVGSSFGPDSIYLAQKGEGIYRNNSSDDAGRGKNANGGGGGNDMNGGGAGGANAGAGGRGGDFQSPISCPPNLYIQSGGISGQALIYSSANNKVFMGGGGGAGHENNYSSTPGGNGAGIIIIKSRAISGSNQLIVANGNNVIDSVSIDGQGGGGAGGSVLIDALFLSGVQIEAKGGKGGSDNYAGWDCHAKGGGGGGGVIWTPMLFPAISTNVNGGAPGLFLAPSSPCFNSSLGASAGQQGAVMNGLSLAGDLNPCENIPVGLEESTWNEKFIRIFPNPVNGKCFVQLGNSAHNEDLKLELVNVLGQVVFVKENCQSTDLSQNGLDLPLDSKGPHLLRLKSAGKVWLGRLVIE